MVETQSHGEHRDQTVFAEIISDHVRRFDVSDCVLSRAVDQNGQDKSTSL